MNRLCIFLLIGFVGATCYGTCPDCPDRMGTLLDSDNGTAASFTARRSGADVGARWKIGVTSQGLYRVTYSQLVAAGADASCLAGSDIRIFCRTQEVAILVSSEGAWATNDYALFYGLGLDGYYSRTNAYWLGLAPGSRRMASRSGAPLPSTIVVTTYCARITHDPDLLYRAFYRPLDDSMDHWFANLISDTARSNFVVGVNHLVPTGTVQLATVLAGLGTTTTTAPDHETEITINGTPIYFSDYDGQVTVSFTNDFAATLLNANGTTVTLRQIIFSNVAANQAQAYLDEFKLDYTRQLFANTGPLAFGGQASSNTYVVDAVSTTGGVRLLDVSDPFAPVSLQSIDTLVTTNGFAVRFGDTTTTGACYFLCTTGQIRNIATLENVHFRDLAATNQQADYLVVSPYAFRHNAYRLLKYRDTTNLTVAAAPISDIYNEFGYGITDAEGLRRFLGYAFHHWSGPAPRYVALLGDGTYDPKDNDNLGAADNLIPVKLGPTPFSRAPEDNWFVTVNGADDLVDMSLGRIPVTSDTVLGYVVDKVIAYEGTPTNSTWRTRATLVADNNTGIDFGQASEAYAKSHLTNGGYTVTLAYLGTPSIIRATISNNINVGRAVVNYFGHGAFYQWADEDIWNTNDIASLTNSFWPVVSVFTCNSGAFQNSTSQTVAEAFLTRQNRGAVACVAPTELSTEVYAEKIADGYFTAFGEQKLMRLGDSLNAGLLNLWLFNTSANELLGYEVFGDPALVVHPP